MGTTTNARLPYPEGTDLVMDGDDAMQALAEALDDKVVIPLSSSAFTATTAPTSYPVGISIIPLGSGEAAAGGWPIASSSQVLTIVNPGGTVRAAQYQFRNSAGVTQAYYRNGSDTGWAPWAGGAAPYGQAAGTMLVTDVAAGATKNATVSLPSGQFSEAPFITLGVYSSGASTRFASHINKSASSFTMCAYNAGGSTGDIYVSWNAVQLTRAAALLQARPTPLGADPVPDATITCPTAGCSNEGIAIPVTTSWVDEDGNTQTVDEYVCGVCNADITDTLTPIDEGS